MFLFNIKIQSSIPRLILYLFIQYIWKSNKKIKWYFIASIICILVSLIIQTYIPLLLRRFFFDLEQNKKTIFSLYGQCTIYGLLWTISHLKIEQLIILIPLQEGMHLFTANLVFQKYGTFTFDNGIFLNALKLAQKGFNDLFWVLFLYFFPVFIQTIATIIILWYMYGFFYASSLIIITFSYMYLSFKNAKGTIKTREEYNRCDSSMLASLHQTNFSKTQIMHAIRQRKHAALQKDYRNFFAHCLQWIIAGIGLTILITISGYQVAISRFNLADFITIKSYALQIALPLTRLGNSILSIQKSITNIQHIFHLFQKKTIPFQISHPAPETSIS